MRNQKLAERLKNFLTVWRIFYDITIFVIKPVKTQQTKLTINIEDRIFLIRINLPKVIMCHIYLNKYIYSCPLENDFIF